MHHLYCLLYHLDKLIMVRFCRFRMIIILPSPYPPGRPRVCETQERSRLFILKSQTSEDCFQWRQILNAVTKSQVRSRSL